jgi:DNA-binding NarL/FixJ family response regulator
MSEIILFTADQSALHLVQAAVAALDGNDLSLVHYSDVSTGLTALLGENQAESHKVRAFMIDVTLPDGDGALVVDALRASGFDQQFVILHDTHAFAMQRLADAASRKPVAMVAKSSPQIMLVAALRRALGIRAIIVEPVASVMPTEIKPVEAGDDETIRAAETAHKVKRLSVREREVLALFVQGYSGKDIARKLGTEIKTVFNQCSSIFEKTGVRPMRKLIALLALVEE